MRSTTSGAEVTHADDAPASSRPASSGPAARAPILLVDDRPANLLALQAVLASPEYEIVIAGSGEAALRELEQRDFAVVLLDVQMPTMDGFETASRMKRSARHKTPIIFLSANDASPARILEAYAGGGVDLIQKPVEPAILRSKVAVFARLYRARQELLTERLKAHERTLFEAMPQLGWLANADGWITYYNQRWYEYTGKTLEEMVGWGWQSVHDPDLLPSVLERWGAAIAAGEPFHMSFPLRRSDGVFRWFMTHATPIRDARGRVQRWIGINTDIDAERRARENAEEVSRLKDALASEEELRRSEERFRLLIEGVGDYAIFMLDPGGHVASWNIGAQRIKGYAANEIIGRHFSTFYPQADIDAGKCEMELEGAARDGRFEDEGWRLRKDGSRFWANVVITAVRNAAGQLVGFSKITRDLSARLEAEEQRLRLARAESESRAKDEFLATVSHELRTPLNAILGWTVTLRARKPPPETDRALAIIERNARRQTRLIEDVLDVSRVISGKLALTLGTTDVADVVHAAVESVMPAADAKGVTLDVVTEPLTITADAGRLQQVVLNLLTNAVKFSHAGGVVSVSVYGEGTYACITVKDSGEGIPPTILPRVFEAFRQADASTTRKHGGLGLGLAIVKQLVAAHSGTVTAESDGVGHGARFTVCLPSRPQVAAIHKDDPLSGSPTTGDGKPAPRLDGLSILVVDDEDDARSLVEQALRDQGATVTGARSAAEALALVTAARVDVIVSDIAMPEMDGYAFVRQVRALPHERGGRTPAIALTAHARQEDAQKAFAAGFQMHVTKPVEPANLVTVVANVAGLSLG